MPVTIVVCGHSNGQKSSALSLLFYRPILPMGILRNSLGNFSKKEAINSMHYATYSKFLNSIICFAENIKDHRKELRSLLSLNFTTVENTSFHVFQNISQWVYKIFDFLDRNYLIYIQKKFIFVFIRHCLKT